MRIRVSFGRSLLLLFGLAVLAGPAWAVSIDWVFVGDAGNAADTTGRGAVAHEYYISKYEVTNAQYAEFLNAKAASDPLALYNTNMDSHAQGGITRSGSAGSFTYAVKPGFADKPVNFMTFWDAVRFTNWLNNGQGNADTETGAYTLLGGTASPSNFGTVTRNPGAIVFLPNQDEWYKAAFYDGLTATYFDYPAGTDALIGCSAPTGTANRANCDNAAGGLTDVGAYTGSPSPYGTFDQGGNVTEWNETLSAFSGRSFRGGSYGEGVSWLHATGGFGTAASTTSSGFGFRVASLVPEPGTALLLMTGLAGLAARQERRKRNV